MINDFDKRVGELKRAMTGRMSNAAAQKVICDWMDAELAWQGFLDCTGYTPQDLTCKLGVLIREEQQKKNEK